MSDRAALGRFAADWFALLNESGADRLPIAADARITENGRAVEWGAAEFAWCTRVGDYKLLALDEEASQIGFIGQIWRGDDVSVCGLRLLVEDGAAREIETIVGPSRFPSTGGVEAASLGRARACFDTIVPDAERMSRGALAYTASLYYKSVNVEQPTLPPFDPAGDRVEAGTRITANPDFAFDFYASLDERELPNFGLWSARDQFLRGLWNADGVTDERYPVVDREYGLVLAAATYRPWHKRFDVAVEGAGRVGPRVTGRRVALDMMEMFKIERDTIGHMESVWSIEDASFASPWC